LIRGHHGSVFVRITKSMSDSANPSLEELRWDYHANTLRRKDLAADPLHQFKKWFADALAAEIREPNAMTLSTIGLDGYPTARTVLMKDYTDDGVTFFTNYESRKGRELEANPVASVLFFWKDLERQALIRGKIKRLAAEESTRYFQSRPYASRIGAWASKQSEEIPNRGWLDERVEKFETEFPDSGSEESVPRPKFWGGYLLVPEFVEFWQGQPGRKHDRFEYSKDEGEWSARRLSP